MYKNNHSWRNMIIQPYLSLFRVCKSLSQMTNRIMTSAQWVCKMAMKSTMMVWKWIKMAYDAYGPFLHPLTVEMKIDRNPQKRFFQTSRKPCSMTERNSQLLYQDQDASFTRTVLVITIKGSFNLSQACILYFYDNSSSEGTAWWMTNIENDEKVPVFAAYCNSWYY